MCIKHAVHRSMGRAKNKALQHFQESEIKLNDIMQLRYK